MRPPSRQKRRTARLPPRLLQLPRTSRAHLLYSTTSLLGIVGPKLLCDGHAYHRPRSKFYAGRRCGTRTRLDCYVREHNRSQGRRILARRSCPLSSTARILPRKVIDKYRVKVEDTQSGDPKIFRGGKAVSIVHAVWRKRGGHATKCYGALLLPK